MDLIAPQPSPAPILDEMARESALLQMSSVQPDSLICFSHLRWDFVYQRPQHLMTRLAQRFPVFYVEEPVLRDLDQPNLAVVTHGVGVTVVVPILPDRLSPGEQVAAQRQLLDRFLAERNLTVPILWYYMPMMRAFSDHLPAVRIVYDCMDELSAFLGAPPELIEREAELLQAADVVLTGGISLYEAKKGRHPNIYPFPSSIDVAHFASARQLMPEPADQTSIPHPRLGHYAVLDERLDIELLAYVADAQPNWQLILVGPVVKIDPAALPRRPNIHYLGPKRYEALPAYLSGWDLAIMPFARNAATRFISPTKTPEYLAAGKRVVSTDVKDVVRTYGETGLVSIAATPELFVRAVERELNRQYDEAWLRQVDEMLARTSWDRTAGEMLSLLQGHEP
ncbi:glycosyltransferase family 1 protein [Inquilinus sp. NPDC058860]|uniref:glycosyltransferase family 1 protein n=1 Tax=Inquilinus sp. NPDC058860 TaxID=3346652 RepID=UPI0036BFBE29